MRSNHCAIALMLAVSGSAVAQPLSCPAGLAGEGTIVMRTGLAVNPDGAAASYTPGDHGYTYINNGVSLMAGNQRLSCSEPANVAECRRAWARAEAGAFGPGTPEFCVFAMEVEPVSAGAGTTACGGGRRIAGNGKGRPRLGAPVPALGGGTVQPYLSTTSLMHTLGGRRVYVDSAAIPGLVAPTNQSRLVGSIAWIRFDGRESFAIVNDTGPRFGEGSVALHQALRHGQIGPIQPVGPIPTSLRCGVEETELRAPFLSRPDAGTADRCRPGYTPVGASDIRAYQGIGSGVTSIVLTNVKPPMSGNVVTEELTVERMRALAVTAGYTPERLRQIADCLRQ